MSLVRATCIVLLAGIAGILSSAAVAQRAEETKSDTIGPWAIEATFKGDRFDRCSIRRTLDDDVTVDLTRTKDGMTLRLASPNWKLERGKRYPVRMNLGGQSWDTEVAADPGAVSIDIEDKRFGVGLRAASALHVVGAGSTIHVPLDQSRAALDRLEECYEKNNRAVETNPFVAPARQP